MVTVYRNNCPHVWRYYTVRYVFLPRKELLSLDLFVDFPAEFVPLFGIYIEMLQ